MGTILRVTELEVRDHPDAVVRANAKVVIVARTESIEVEGPSNLHIEWSGDLGLNPEINSNILETHFAPGAHTVTATGIAGGSSVTVRAWQSETEVVNGSEFAISAEPQMPVITARVRIIGPVTATFNDWTCRVRFAGADDCPNMPHFEVINDDLELTQAGGDQFTPSFDKVRGRSVSFSVRFTIGGQTREEFAFAYIRGTNPQRSEVQAALPHNTLRRIACRESGQRQFSAPANVGVSACPLYSSDRRGRVGIMQVPDPTPDHIWNWRLNVEKGIEHFNERMAAAGEYPSRVRNSEGFRNLVAQFNQRRQRQGLDPIQVVLPDFTTGNLDDDLQQLELDAIRGYNGWEGSDRFGFEMHEFRVAVDVVDGEEVLRVTNINEQTLMGEAVWEQVPVEERPQNLGEPTYVNDVLAFAPNCLFQVPIRKLINHTFLMLDDFSKPLDWNEHIIGLHKEAQKINIQIEGKFLNLISLTVQLTTRVANKESGVTSGTPVRFHVFKDDAASGANRTVYRLTLNIDTYDLPTRRNVLEVATIARPGGTSDKFFRDALGWAPRGISTLPGAVGDVTGNDSTEVPDALQLLRAGGVEVLEVELIDLPADVIVLESKCSRLIRSPADIVYVSSHGLYAGNCVALDDTPANAHDHSYSCWSTAAALDKWNNATARVAVGDTSNIEGREPTVLILAGCSLLTIKTSGAPRGPGLAWANFLSTKNGPLKAILGYRKGASDGNEGSAPSDSGGGNVIGLAMGTIIAETGGALDYVQAWLKINMAAKALFAAGIDKDGYWWMERKTFRRWKYEIKGPIRLP